jgi:hypothetical protein
MADSNSLVIPSEHGESFIVKYDEAVLRSLDTLLSLLSSYFKSTSDGPVYVRSLKQISRELALIKVKLDAIKDDRSFIQTRTEFLHQNVTSLVFPNEYPEFGASDIEFKSFLVKVIALYMRGATTESLRDGVQYITGGNVVIFEHNNPRATGKSFKFDVNVYLAGAGFAYKALTEKAVKILVDILKPAHTIYTVNYILSDTYDKTRLESETSFSHNWTQSEYFRYSYNGVSGNDVRGRSPVVNVTNWVLT